VKITVNVPEYSLLAENPAEFGRRIALSAALWMFRSGELSAGAAAELAGMDRLAFSAECRRHGIAVINYDPQQLEEEVETLRRMS
jgi:predicted HTH domain antitoxin